MRRMTPARRLYYSLGLPLLRLINWALLKSYRFQPVIGMEHAEALLQSLGARIARAAQDGTG